jgi:hypothetical protein
MAIESRRLDGRNVVVEGRHNKPGMAQGIA